MRMAKTVVIGILGFVISSCATGYTEPSGETPHSNFIFQKSVSSKLLFRGEEPTIVTYQVYKDSECKEPVPAANFSSISKTEKSLKFNANTPQRLVVNMVYKTGSIGVVNGVAVPTGPIEQKNCIGVAKFTPQEKQSYRLSAQPTDNPEVCVLNVVNVETKEAPIDLVQGEKDVCK